MYGGGAGEEEAAHDVARGYLIFLVDLLATV